MDSVLSRVSVGMSSSLVVGCRRSSYTVDRSPSLGSVDLVRIAYVSSRYPAVSHTFIQREVAALRALGIHVDTVAIRRASAGEVLSEADRAEARSTYAILPVAPRHLARSHLGALLRYPRAYAATLTRALTLAPAGLRGRLWQMFYFAEAVLLWDRCRRRRVGHLHAHLANVGSDVALLAAALGAAAGRGPRSWSMTMHGSTEFYDVSAHRLPEKVADAAFVACVSDFTRSQLMLVADPQHWAKLELVRCGVDPSAFAAVQRDGDRAPLRVLAVSRLVPGKGFALLLDALAQVVGDGHDLALDVVGEGPAGDALRARAARLGVAERVRWLGAVGQDEIRRHYARADAFCLPSFAEGVPVVLMEAMAVQLPVVATRIAGIPELVTDEISGLLVTPARVDELAGALSRLAASPQLRERLGRAGREAVLAGYDADRWARRLAELFERHAPHST
jgi:glycosyltransferase involved in cell wall biosynthesis